VSTNVLPDGWTLKKFSAIAASITERVDDPSASGVERYVGLEHLDPESTSIRRWGSPSDVEATKLRFYPGDVIYGRRRAYQRKLGVADFDGICSAHALVLRAKPDVCLPEFLPYFLQSDAFHQRALDISVGSLSPTINWKTLAVQEFALPPIDEQQRIVELLSAADAHVSSLERQGTAARAARSAVLSELLSAGGDDWIESALSEIAEVVMGQSPPGKTYNSEGIGIPFMQGSAEFGPHVPQPLKWCSSPAKIAEIGDLLLSVRAPVGDTNLANQRIAIGRGLAVIRARAGSLTPFLRLFLQANVVGLVSRSGTGMFHSITGANLKQFRVTVPPLEEQQRIVNIVSSMDDVTQSAEKAVLATKILRSGLLTVLLAGAEL